MGWFFKVAGFAVGFFVGGPPGAVAGLALGAGADENVDQVKDTVVHALNTVAEAAEWAGCAAAAVFGVQAATAVATAYATMRAHRLASDFVASQKVCFYFRTYSTLPSLFALVYTSPVPS